MIWLPLLALLAATPAGAQNTQCATRTAGDNSNACATTAFVTAAIAAIPSQTLTANSVLGNATSGTAAGTSLAIPSCSTNGSAVKYTTNTGFGCNTTIDAATLGGATFAAPGSIGSGTPAAGAFTTLSASSTVSGTGFSTYLASPPAIGGTAPAAGKFTTLEATSTTTLAPGTVSIAPLLFQSGTLMTTPSAGSMNYDGAVFYSAIEASNRGVAPSQQFVILTSSNTLTNNTSAQPVFDGGGGPTNGRITLSTGTYFFQEYWDISGLNGLAHTISASFGGTATIGTMKYMGNYLDTSAGVVHGNAATAITIGTAGTTSATLRAQFSGVFTVTVAGTVIPQITQGTASAAATVLAGSYMRLYKVGTSSVTYVGNWD